MFKRIFQRIYIDNYDISLQKIINNSLIHITISQATTRIITLAQTLDNTSILAQRMSQQTRQINPIFKIKFINTNLASIRFFKLDFNLISHLFQFSLSFDILFISLFQTCITTTYFIVNMTTTRTIRFFSLFFSVWISPIFNLSPRRSLLKKILTTDWTLSIKHYRWKILV